MNDKSTDKNDGNKLSGKRLKFSIGYVIVAILIMSLLRIEAGVPFYSLSGSEFLGFARI